MTQPDHTDLASRIAKHMSAFPPCRMLGLLFLGLHGRSLKQIQTVAEAKGMSVDDAADLLVKTGYEVITERGNPREDKSIPIEHVHRHEGRLDDRVAGLRKTETETGHPARMSGVVSASGKTLGIPKSIESRLFSARFATRFRDRDAELEIMPLGLSLDEGDGRRFRTEYARLNNKRKEEERLRLEEVAAKLVEAIEGVSLEGLEYLWPTKGNKRSRKIVRQHPQAAGDLATRALNLRDESKGAANRRATGKEASE